MSKKLIVEAKLYVVLWEHDSEHGGYRERHRILSISAEDAIEQTRPLAMFGARLIRAETLAEHIEIAVTAKLWKAAWGDGRGVPYEDEDVRLLMEETKQ